MDMAAAPMAIINTVKLSQGFSLVVYRQVVRYQLGLRVLLQKEMPEMFEVNTQSVGRALPQVIDQISCIPVQLLQPKSPVGGKFETAGRNTGGRTSDSRKVQQRRGEAGPGKVAYFLSLVGIYDDLCATMFVPGYNSSPSWHGSRLNAGIF
jgi:hypothetical protein